MQDGILEWAPQAPDTEALRRRLHLDEDSEPEDLETLDRMIRDCTAAARPKALFRVTPVTARGADWVELDGVRVASALAAQKLPEVCAAYIATCGAEAGAWAAQYRGDPLLQFWADELLLVFLRQASAGLHEVLKREVFGGRDYASLNPGSLKEWPITGQRPLFTLLGAGEDGVVPGLGVRLTRECLMLPAKSVSGLAFLSEAGFVNCAYCPRVSCPNRRAPYGGTSPLS